MFWTRASHVRGLPCASFYPGGARCLCPARPDALVGSSLDLCAATCGAGDNFDVPR